MQEEAFPSSQRDSLDVKAMEAWKSLNQVKESLVTLFTTQTKRPPIKRPNKELSDFSGDGYSWSVNSDPPDIDRSTPEELVNVVDAMMNAAFRNVTEEVRVNGRTISDCLADMIIGHPRHLRPSRDPVHRPYWLVRYSRAGNQRRRDRGPDFPFVGLRGGNHVVGL